MRVLQVVVSGVHQFGRHVCNGTAEAGLCRRVDTVDNVYHSRQTKVAETGTSVLIDDDVVLQSRNGRSACGFPDTLVPLTYTLDITMSNLLRVQVP